MVKKTYTVGALKQLVELNKGLVNFDLSFTVRSKDGSPFDLIVVDQDSLDNGRELQYEKADKGMISGTLSSDKNIPQAYFLVLRSDKPCEVECDVEVTEIPPKLPPPLPLQTQPGPMMQHPAKSQGFNFKPWLILIIVVCSLAIVYMIFFRKKDADTSNPIHSSEHANTVTRTEPIFKFPDYQTKPSRHSSLLSKLNNLPG